MDPDLTLIFGFILTIVSLAMMTGILIHRSQIRTDERKLELEAQVEQAKADQARFGNGDYSKMEERVRVLERIATDSNHALAAQIDELRALDAVEDKRETAS
ncbi:hypothetical protein [Qipengyuania gelatinilytica]|uniref:Uncharacterized protein n=1 Tax=Qipengyuania gelatinilytica TaxID=2867231 RepID=A0ABX9A4A2_9SPHN|nr:hypothetical protein [Qipengyuania gelatinilytica]QZD96090.1 hypothetical protein K3136_05135 [Qipengyuania gelatinilytica]